MLVYAGAAEGSQKWGGAEEQGQRADAGVRFLGTGMGAYVLQNTKKENLLHLAN